MCQPFPSPYEGKLSIDNFNCQSAHPVLSVCVPGTMYSLYLPAGGSRCMWEQILQIIFLRGPTHIDDLLSITLSSWLQISDNCWAIYYKMQGTQLCLWDREEIVPIAWKGLVLLFNPVYPKMAGFIELLGPEGQYIWFCQPSTEILPGLNASQ